MKFTRKSTKYMFSAFLVLVVLSLSACFNGSSSSSKTRVDEPVVIASLSVTSTAPAGAQTDVGTNSKVVAVFNKGVTSESVNQTNFTLHGASETAVVAAVSYDAATRTATLTPNGGLSSSTVYTATLREGIENEAGESLLEEVVWTFTTGNSEDKVAPTLNADATTPKNLAEDVLRNTKLNIVFSEAMDPTTVTGANIILTDASGPVTGALSYVNPTTVVFSPSEILDSLALHTLTLSGSIADLAGNTLDEPPLTFKTGEKSSLSPAAVDLGTAEDYVLLAKTGISTTGATKVVGDIAVSPEVRASLTGFADTLSADGTFATSALVTGKLFAANMTAPTPTTLTTAVNNMQTAYTYAAGVATDFTELGAGQIGGLTLEPGVYHWGTNVLVSSDVTLNGDENAVWIFQVDQDLKLEDGKSIILAGGALPANIFWQVAGEVTLQAGTTFNGIILGQTAVVMKSGAVLNGRALAQTAVTLIANDVNQPAE